MQTASLVLKSKELGPMHVVNERSNDGESYKVLPDLVQAEAGFRKRGSHMKRGKGY